MSKIFSQDNNKENWEQLAFVLQERDKPTFIVIGFDSYATQKTIFKELKNEFSKYRFYELDLSSLNIVSLNQVFINRLPETILNSKPSEYIVNVFGLENSLFTVQNKNIVQSSLIAELNFEREILFQRFPFITIIWTDSYTVSKLKKEAKDLWDWISYYFEFKREKEADNDTINITAGRDVVFGKDQAIVNVKYSQDNKLQKTRIFISYARNDFEIAKKLYDDLKDYGFHPWLDKEELLVGQNWKLAVLEAIRKSEYFLALISSKSVNQKGYIHTEMKMALDILDELHSYNIFIIPVYLEPFNPPEHLQHIKGVNLYESYKEGFKKILMALNYSFATDKIRTADKNLKHSELNRNWQSERINRINMLNKRYDLITLDDTSRERVIKEKINIQKLLGQEYMELEDYEKAKQSFRIALALCEQIDGLEYENDEISFLLRQIHYQPIIQPNEIKI
ncbi:Toll-Interleukin receptor domain protein [Candidatus Magnetomorum sp. HK-1]|nr:Toll-Interleukin receptor domain protein [Candidatus Magnetomorum sp. HK-1]